MRRGGGARPSLLPPPLCATPGVLWWSALRARAARPGGVRGLPRSRARPPSSGGRSGAALLRTVEAAALRSSAGSRRFALVALARCARLQSPFVLGSLRSRCGAPSRGPFSARAPLRGRPGARLRRAFTLGRPLRRGAASWAASVRVGGFPHPLPSPAHPGGGNEGSRPPTGGEGGLTQPLPSYRIPPPAGLLRVSTRMHAAYKGPGLPESGKFPLDKAAIRVVRCSRGVASAVSSQHRPRKGP